MKSAGETNLSKKTIQHLYNKKYQESKGIVEENYKNMVDYATILQFLLPLRKSLDIGTGSGRIANFCSGLASSTVGIDISGEAVRKAKEGCKWNEIFLVADVNYLPFKRATFDNICVFGTFECFTLNQLEKALLECYRVLAPNGRIIFHVWNKTGLKLRLTLRHSLLVRGHLPQEVSQLMWKLGYTVRDLRGYYLFLPRLVKIPASVLDKIGIPLTVTLRLFKSVEEIAAKSFLGLQVSSNFLVVGHKSNGSNSGNDVYQSRKVENTCPSPA